MLQIIIILISIDILLNLLTLRKINKFNKISKNIEWLINSNEERNSKNLNYITDLVMSLIDIIKK